MRSIALVAESVAQVILSDVLRQQGDLDGSVRAAEEAAAAATAIGHERAMAKSKQMRARVLLELGRADEARPLLEDALDEFTRVVATRDANETHLLVDGLQATRVAAE